MRTLSKRKRGVVIGLLLVIVASAVWLYWNRTLPSDLSVWAPADSLAYLELNDLAHVANGVQETEAWKSLGPLLNAPANLSPNRWFIRLARWTGHTGAPDSKSSRDANW